jgi:hypothetical protein
MSCPDVALSVSVARPSGGKAKAARLRARVEPGEGLNEDFVYLFFSKVSNAGISVNIFTVLF